MFCRVALAIVGAAAVATAAGAAAVATAAGASRVGDSWGVNIHWTEETEPGEAAMLATAFKIARMDMSWQAVEKAGACGTYDFTAYDSLLATMRANGVRPYWILGERSAPAARRSRPPAACRLQESRSHLALALGPWSLLPSSSAPACSPSSPPAINRLLERLLRFRHALHR